jgi:HB1, ASXL, restriction endonuclease HTH domain
MDKSHVISALFRKYCHLMGQAKRHPDCAAEYQADMAHVEAVIRMFRPDADLSRLKPIRARNDTRWRKRGYGVRTTIEILRQAGRPLSTREIAEEVMRHEGLSPDDVEARRDVCSSLHMSILRRVGKDIVRVDGYPMRWALA